jgi:hypothetical protein
VVIEKILKEKKKEMDERKKQGKVFMEVSKTEYGFKEK